MSTVIGIQGHLTQEILQNGSDKFSIVFMYTTLTILVLMPFSMALFIYRNRNDLNNPDFVKKYGFIFADLSTKTPEQAIFHLIYMIRRIIFVLITIFMNNLCFFQIIAHTVLTIVYTSYMLKKRPFKDNETNKIHVFNEISLLLTTYVLITLGDQNITEDQRYNMGYCYILFCSANMIYNVYGILVKTYRITLPMAFKKYQTY
jgi:hypothetical protein